MEHCECKKTVRASDEKKALINRLSRIEGQIRGIKAMVESDAYCVDILTQSAAAKQAFNALVGGKLVNPPESTTVSGNTIITRTRGEMEPKKRPEE